MSTGFVARWIGETSRRPTSRPTGPPGVRPSGRGSGTRPRRPRPWEVVPAGRRGLWALLALALTVLTVLAVWFAFQLNQARSHLQAASVHVQALGPALGAGDTRRAGTELTAAQDESAAARDVTDGALWPVFAAVPLIGDDVRAVRTVATSVDDVTQNGLPSVVEAGRALGPGDFAFDDGRLDLSPLVRLRPSVATLHDVLSRNDGRLDAIEADGLLGVLQGPVRTLQSTVSDAADTSDTAERAMRVLPAMLGAGGERTYLVTVQSNARIRATGGYPGTYLLVTAEDGKVAVAGQGASATDLRSAASAPRSDDEDRLFDGRLGRRFVDATLTPDFPRAAELQASSYERDHAATIDGVVSIDPVALSYLLEGLGPVELDSGPTLTSDNVAEVLLNRVYDEFPKPAAQDRYLQQVARRLFLAFTDGVGEPRQVLDALSRGASEGRILVWSSHLEDEIVFAGSAVSGAMPPTRSRRPQVGVYLNDTSDARLQYYLDRSLDVGVGRCGAGGAQLFVSTALESRVAETAAGRPGAVNGSGRKVPPGTMQMDVLLYAPAGGTVDDVEVANRSVTPRLASYEGRTVAVVPVTVAPGERVTVTAEMTGARRQTGRPQVETTPGASFVPVRLNEPPCG